MSSGKPHVVIVGGGFGGLTLAQELSRVDVDVTLVDRTNHHLFQPLLYQVATAGLSPADIASPIRAILRDASNVRVVLAEVSAIDPTTRTLSLASGESTSELGYDTLVLSTGVVTNYFGHPEWARWAAGMKDLDEALEVRRRVLVAFEEAERSPGEGAERLLTFVVIGAGPTGVELAGAFAELAKSVLATDFRRIDPTRSRVVLVEAGPRVLGSFPEELGVAAREQLEALGVEVRLDTMVTRIDARGVTLKSGERIDSETVVWAAGVRGAPLVASLGAKLDRMGRVLVDGACALPEHPEIFVIGDAAAFDDTPAEAPEGTPRSYLPGVAPVATQQARFVARIIERERAGDPRSLRGRFRYLDKGSMATIGRSRAVMWLGRLRLRGMIAWLGWLFIHLLFLVGFRNRFVVLFSWAWSYVTFQRGARLITGHRMEAGAPVSLRAPRPTQADARDPRDARDQRGASSVAQAER